MQILAKEIPSGLMSTGKEWASMMHQNKKDLVPAAERRFDASKKCGKFRGGFLVGEGTSQS